MKLAGPSALAFAEKPRAGVRIALFFGADPGLVSAAADTLAKVWLPDADPINLVKLSDDDIKRDPQLLADELVARSLLGGDRLVRVRAEKDAISKTLIEVLGDVESGVLNPEAAWIIEGGELNKSNKLRVAFEDSAKAMALQLFADDEATISDFIASRLQKAGVAIDPQALTAFAAELPGDRRLAMSEVEKLELYALDLGRPVNLEDIALIATADQPRGADDAADAAIAGDIRGCDRAIDRFLDAGGSPISALRTLHFRMLRVADASAGSQGMRLRPPVFDREWPAFQRSVRDWPSSKLHTAFTRLYEAEKTCKQAGAPSEAIVRRLLERISKRDL
jgi:DNA polymerase-3 subunit delta